MDPMGGWMVGGREGDGAEGSPINEITFWPLCNNSCFKYRQNKRRTGWAGDRNRTIKRPLFGGQPQRRERRITI